MTTKTVGSTSPQVTKSKLVLLITLGVLGLVGYGAFLYFLFLKHASLPAMVAVLIALGCLVIVRQLTPQKRREVILGYLYLLPAMTFLFTFSFFPVAYAMYISLHKWRIKKQAYLGLGNYRHALGEPSGVITFLVGCLLLLAAWWVSQQDIWSERNRLVRIALVGLLLLGGLAPLVVGVPIMGKTGDPDLWNSLKVTLYYVIGTVPIQLAISLVLAYLLFQKIKGKTTFRMIYFLPYVTSLVASSSVWAKLFNPRGGLFNRILQAVGLPALRWLQEPRGIGVLLFGPDIPSWAAGPSLAQVAVLIFVIWFWIGYDTTIFLAGLGNIPNELYEAARIDGANGWDLFRHITLPLLSPTTFFLTLVAVIGSFKAFAHIFVMTSTASGGVVGGPIKTNMTAAIFIYNTFYTNVRNGYASAIAFILFALILAITLFQNYYSKKWVFYS
ncbi:MAG: sugar ABC transporter permease [Anaerolineae bacterium]|nr:sugar ABC transporter permease [Anaerolineae bacterium]